MNMNGILVDRVQLEKEQQYVVPTEPEMKSKAKIQKIPVKEKFEGAQCLLVNYIADDYKLLLKKIISLMPIIPSSLRMLIVPLPKGASYVDQYFAKRIQRMASQTEDRVLLVLFIPH